MASQGITGYLMTRRWLEYCATVKAAGMEALPGGFQKRLVTSSPSIIHPTPRTRSAQVGSRRSGTMRIH